MVKEREGKATDNHLTPKLFKWIKTLSWRKMLPGSESYLYQPDR